MLAAVGIKMQNQIKVLVGRRMQAIPARMRDILRLVNHIRVHLYHGFVGTHCWREFGEARTRGSLAGANDVDKTPPGASSEVPDNPQGQ